MAKAYRVVYERDEDGVWVASVPAVRGCRTQGKSIAQARERIREALGLFVNDAKTAEFKEKLELPRDLHKLVIVYHDAKERAAAERLKAQAAESRVVMQLKRCGFTVRDAGEALNLSHQRVQQLLERKAN